MDHGNQPKDVESPLVRRLNKRADEPGDDDNPCEECRRQDVRQRQAGCEQEGNEEQREVDEPLDVPDVLMCELGARA